MNVPLDKFIETNDMYELIKNLFLKSEYNLNNKHEEDVNQFYFEYVPIVIYAKKTLATHVKFPSGKPSYDGVIKFKDGSEKKIECTCGERGRETEIKACLIKGLAPAPQDSLENISIQIKEAINQKRKLDRPDYKNAILIICFHTVDVDNNELLFFIKNKKEKIEIKPFSKLCIFNKTTLCNHAFDASFIYEFDE